MDHLVEAGKRAVPLEKRAEKEAGGYPVGPTGNGWEIPCEDVEIMKISWDWKSIVDIGIYFLVVSIGNGSWMIMDFHPYIQLWLNGMFKEDMSGITNYIQYGDISNGCWDANDMTSTVTTDYSWVVGKNLCINRHRYKWIIISTY